MEIPNINTDTHLSTNSSSSTYQRWARDSQAVEAERYLKSRLEATAMELPAILGDRYTNRCSSCGPPDGRSRGT